MTISSADRQIKLAEFSAWVTAHIRGDEKGEAQIYLDHLFAAFGLGGVREVGAILEERIKKEDGRGTSFADLVWKPVVLIEMKKRGVDLSRHYRQAFDYWTRLVPGRPRYVVLCNFDEFWVYDFETQMDSPVDKLALVDLPQRYGPLAFLFPTNEAPVFGNDQESVTRQAADKLAACFNSMLARKVDRSLAQRFTLQSLMALFSEDIGLLERYFFTRLLDDCGTPAQAYDLIGGLFDAMNSQGRTPGGRFKGVDYFNGGLFATPARVELATDEIQLLREAASFDWSQVRPEIFGALFEHSMGKEERHAFGAHFTSANDIMKIVGPTIAEPWRERIEKADTLKQLQTLLARIERFKVLDPACGSGNFLYIAYRELKRLEAMIYQRMADEYKSVNPAQRPFGFVTARNFYGMDINPFAVELAKVTMMLAHKLAIDELHVTENALPLDNLDANFTIGDALLRTDGSRTPWPEVDVIIGNPPFLGAKRLKPEHGADYANRLRDTYPEVPGMADYCVYWFRRAQEHLPTCTQQDPVAGRAGLVGTQNIRNNASRVGGLDHVAATGTIIEAVDNQPWSGEANVHVSIANWAKTQDEKLLPRMRRLWFKVDSPKGLPRRPRGSGSAAKDYELDMREVTFINSALSDKADVSQAQVLACNTDPQLVYQGLTPGHKAFVLSEEQRQALVAKPGNNASLIHPYLIGDEILSKNGSPERFLLDFEQRSVLEAQAFTAAFAHVKTSVLPDRLKAAEEGKDEAGNLRSHHKAFLDRWWQLSWGRADLIAAISQLPRYLVCSRVTKRPIFAFVSSAIRPGDALQCFAFADDYSFGVLQSRHHWVWFTEKCSKLTERFRYTPESVFNTFPWPQSPTKKQIETVAEAARHLRQIRAAALTDTSGGLRAIYRTLELPGTNPLREAHVALDQAVHDAYGFPKRCDLLEQLLKLNLDVAGRIERGESVVVPGIPPGYKTPAKIISADCIQP